MNLMPDPINILISFGLFIATYLLMSSLLIKPVAQVLKKRREEVFNAKERAKELDEAAEARKHKYFVHVNEVRQRGAAVRNKARAESLIGEKQMLDEASAALKPKVEALQRELEAEMISLQSELMREKNALAAKAASGILKRPVG